MKQKRTFLTEDKEAIEKINQNAQSVAALVKLCIEQYNALGIDDFQIDDLQSLVENPDGFIREKCFAMVTDIPKINGLSLRREAILDQLELPNYSSLKRTIDSLKAYLKSQDRNLAFLGMFDYQDGRVIAKDDQLRAIIESNRKYTQNDTEESFAVLYNNYLKTYNELSGFLKDKGFAPDGLKGFQPDLIVKHDSDTGEAVFSTGFFYRIFNR